MMFLKKFIGILCCMFVLTGCGERGSVSLEEALLSAGNDTSGYGSAGADSETADGSNTEVLLYVYVCGSVVKPGVYMLEPGSRIVAAIEAAGGFLENAATEAVNLAAPVYDGMQIVVPDETEAVMQQLQEERQEAGQISLNRATAEELCSLPGIGQTKAEAIIAYREEIGSFSSIEQLKNVTGIGDSLFEQIKESIYIE